MAAVRGALGSTVPLQTQPAASQNLRPKCPVSAVFRAEGVTVAEPRALASESVVPKLFYATETVLFPKYLYIILHSVCYVL